MNLEVNGITYSNFISAQCTIRLDSIASTFAFTATNPNGTELPFKGGESCRVSIDDEVVLTGTIEVINLSYDSGDHIISIQGRSLSSKLLDSTLGIFDDVIGEGLTLKALIKNVLKHINLQIPVYDNVNPEPFNLSEDIAAPEPGDNAFKFVEEYARKRQVLLRPSADGGIVIDRNSGISSEGSIQHILNSDNNNVISSSYNYDITGRFNLYRVASQLNPTPLNFANGTDLAALVNQEGGVFDNNISQGRQLVIISETSYSSGDLSKRAKWEADIRRARSQTYNVQLPLFRIQGNLGELWQINRLYKVKDDFVGKNISLLCNGVQYSLSSEGGSTTSLELIDPYSYTLSLEDTEGDVAINLVN